jgi:hypothetical protein
MPGFAPANYIAGPAVITFDSYTYFTKGDIQVRALLETFDVRTSLHGKIDERLKSRAYEIRFTPCGEVETVAKYFPYGAAQIGASIFAASDKTVQIDTLAGQRWTFSRCAINKMPGLRLSAGDTAYTEMSILCLLKTSTEPTTDAAFAAVAAQAFSHAEFDETKITSPGYTAAWGTSPYDVMESVDGFTFEVNMGLRMDNVDRYGLVNVRLTSLEPSVRFTPAGLTESQWDALVIPDGASAVVPGQSLAKAGTDLVISKGAGYLKLTIADAGIKDHALAFGEAPRLGELTFSNKRTWTAGVANEPFVVEIQSA